MTWNALNNKLKSKVRLWLWQRNYRKQGQYKPPRKLYVVVKVVAGREYGYWRGCYKYNGHTFTHQPLKAYKFRCKKQAEATADNAMLHRYSDYKVVRYRK